MALYNLVFARHHQGRFVLRIEDTDQKRSRPEYEQNIYNALKWCGIEWDEGPDVGGEYGPYRQSERSHIYREYCDKLIAAGHAYKCFATPQELDEMRQVARKSGQRASYDRRYRNLSEKEVEERIEAGQSYVVRLKVPRTGECVFEDAIKGRVTVPWADVDDQVLLKSDGLPTYHLANVVDDHLMEISHVIRGDEWMSSVPKHVLLYQYFGWEPPTFIHMPLLLGTDGKKLSKRRNPTSIFYYRDAGYLQEAFINFLSLMGYSMPEDREVYSVEELIEQFDIKRIGVSGAVFDITKLEWLNQEYLIKNIPVENLWDRIKQWSFNDAFMAQVMPLVHTRIKTFGDFIDLCGFLFVNHVHYREELFLVRGMQAETVCAMMQYFLWELEGSSAFHRDMLYDLSKKIAAAFSLNHKKNVMPILFGALMGKHQGPPFFDSAILLGKDRTRVRFLSAMEFLGGLSNKKLVQLRKAYDRGDLSEFLASDPVPSH